MSIELVMPSIRLNLCHPLLLPPSIFPSIRVFSNESILHIRWPRYWASASVHYTYFIYTTTVYNWVYNLLCFPCLHDRRCRRLVFHPWVGKITWRRAWQPTPVLLLGKFHGQRSRVGCVLWDHKELDMTEVTEHVCVLYIVFRRI